MILVNVDSLSVSELRSIAGQEGIDGADVQLASEMGDVRASLAGAKEAYTIRVRTEMGESNVVDRDGGSRRLTAETGMGNIRIEFLG